MLSGRITHLRDDDRFKAIGPDNFVLTLPSAPVVHHQGHQGPPSAAAPKHDVEEGEVWFDWAFVDFWKSNYCECPRTERCLGADVDISYYRHDTERHCGRPELAFLCCWYV